MKRFKLPIFRGRLNEPRSFSNDEYLKFVEFNLKHNFDRKAYAKWKKILAVNEPFFIK